jgi:hypothetical protein
LKAGEPVRLLADLAFSPLIVFHAPGAEAARLVDAAALALDWRGRVALLWDENLDSRALGALARRGALTASASLAPDLDRPQAILEGDGRAVRMCRRWLAKAAVPAIALTPGGKTRFLASWAASSACLVPLLDGVSEGLESAGLPPNRARRLAARWIDAGVRRYSLSGKHTGPAGRLAFRNQSLKRGLHSLAAADPELLGRYEAVLRAVGAVLARPWFAGVSSEPLKSG